ncbi:MAG: hypothetical protein AAGA77_23870 [Bacteroidota bacterium]
MKAKNLLFCTLFFCFTLGMQPLNAQMVEEASITANEANFKMISPNSYLMEIAGPNDYYFRQEIESTNNISISNVDMEGNKFPDGTYKMQVTPIVTLSETIRQELTTLRNENDPEKIAAFRLENELPATVNVYNISFSIRNGQFVSPDQEEAKGLNLPNKMTGLIWEQDLLLEQDHPVLYASLNNVDMEYGKPAVASNALPLATDNTPMMEDDQVFLDDVIVEGSICVGLDCTNGESFGFDTQRLKENNLRIHFNDTSASASFPSNDWRITINDSTNGGGNYFAVEDATAGNIPFRIEAGAGANALYVDDAGNVGVGTATPVVETHIADGDSPTLRLEQNGSSGFTPQTWDVAGNETNFFVRDVTNGSKLPFKIIPNAPTNSIYVASSGNVGLATSSPDANLDVESSGTTEVRITTTGTAAAQFVLNSLNTWQFRSLSDGDMVIRNGLVGGDPVPVRIGSGAANNLLQIGETASDVINVNGSITATGTITPDYVFESDYELETIEEHAEYMWREKHLPAVEAAQTDGNGKGLVSLVERSQQTLEELEKAHIYIEQLHKRIKNEKEISQEVNNKQQQTIDQQTKEIADLKTQLTKMETQLAELIQVVSNLNKK